MRATLEFQARQPPPSHRAAVLLSLLTTERVGKYIFLLKENILSRGSLRSRFSWNEATLLLAKERVLLLEGTHRLCGFQPSRAPCEVDSARGSAFTLPSSRLKRHRDVLLREGG